LGQYGHSKDHRPDLKQVVLAVVIDGRGRPICSELWPGNTTDVTTLLPVIERLKTRFLIARIGVVADRGMISAATLAELDARNCPDGKPWRRRYLVCRNEAEAQQDKAEREAILAALEAALRRGDKSLVGNRGYRRFLKLAAGRRFE